LGCFNKCNTKRSSLSYSGNWIFSFFLLKNSITANVAICLIV
jgi:hypothetical protein